MKKIIFFLILFFSFSILAQPAKVLICAPGDLKVAQATDTILKKFYHEKIDISDTFTDAINNYDAVFLELSYKHPISIPDGNFLKGYLHSNKKLFVEGIELSTDASE